MLASNLAWNLWCELLLNDTPEEHQDQPKLLDQSDRWIWGVWIVIALIAVAALPFSARLQGVAEAVASFCGFSIG